jgi:plasmid stabilization system protein ParE
MRKCAAISPRWNRAASLAVGQGFFKDMSALFPALRMARCEHHYVFCLPREGAPALIMAIFHERMDLMTIFKRGRRE